MEGPSVSTAVISTAEAMAVPAAQSSSAAPMSMSRRWSAKKVKFWEGDVTWCGKRALNVSDEAEDAMKSGKRVYPLVIYLLKPASGCQDLKFEYEDPGKLDPNVRFDFEDDVIEADGFPSDFPPDCASTIADKSPIRSSSVQKAKDIRHVPGFLKEQVCPESCRDGKLEIVFTCPFCTYESCVECQIDMKELIGKAVCGICKENFSIMIDAFTEH